MKELARGADVDIRASDGVRLAARRMGSGEPVYAIHGGPESDSKAFGDALDPIGEYRELYLLDQRGCGASEDAPPVTYTLERLVQDIDEFRESRQHDMIDLLAHSFGGVVAFEYARRFPERVRLVVFVAAAFRGWRGLLYLRAWPVWARVFWLNIRGGDWIEFHLKHEIGDQQKASQVRRAIESTRADRARAGSLMRAGSQTRDARSLASSIRLFGVYGLQDRRFLADAANLAQAGAKVLRVDRCGHFPYIEQPEIFHDSVRHFLNAR